MGIDPAGRAFRWKVGDEEEVGCSFLVMGCPPMPFENDEFPLWYDSFSFRPQIHLKNEKKSCTPNLWSAEMQWKALYSNGLDNNKYKDAADNIVAALRDANRCPPKGVSTTAFAIPNRLSEDSQDALLKSLAWYNNPVLIWRPIAVMLHWLSNLVTSPVEFYESNSDAFVWVLDLDSPCLELTRLSWKRHKNDSQWIAPVRSYPHETKSNKYKTLRIAWNEIFNSVDEKERDQLITSQVAPEVQKNLEMGPSSFNVWTCNNHRWRKVLVEKPVNIPRTVSALSDELKQHVSKLQYSRTSSSDIVLVNGWLARLYPDEVKEVVRNCLNLKNVELMPAEAIASGAQLFADRFSRGLPTYYDQLPEYRTWTDKGWRVLVEKEQEVEPGHPWKLNDFQLQSSFSIGQYRDNLSLLVQRIPVMDKAKDFARRLRIGLNKSAMKKIPLYLDAEVKPAQGSARFVVKATNEEKPFVYDERTMTKTAELSYGFFDDDVTLGKSTTKEPEHKGYLEAQPVIGRIYDSEENLNLLRIVVEHYNALALMPGFNELRNAVVKYREDDPAKPPSNSVSNCILLALERWGYHRAPTRSQPTKGLFGTKNLPNIEVSKLCVELSKNLWEGAPPVTNRAPRNVWSKRQNYCHVFASGEYKQFIRNVLKNSDRKFQSWSEAYAPGYVLGEQPGDLKLLAEYSIARKFDISEDGYSDKHFWAFFRMMCWHPEVKIEEKFIRRYLFATIEFVKKSSRLGGQSKKYIVFAILFALRIREQEGACKFLLDEEGKILKEELISLLIDGGALAHVGFPKTMIAHLNGVVGNFSDYTRRFILCEDTVEDRELGSSIAVSD